MMQLVSLAKLQPLDCRKRTGYVRVAAAGTALLAIACPVHADAGVPLMACISPGFWLMLPAIIILEALIALRILRKGAWVAFKVAAVANLASTLAGIPLRLIITAALTPLFKSGVSLIGANGLTGSLPYLFGVNVLGRWRVWAELEEAGFIGSSGSWLAGQCSYSHSFSSRYGLSGGSPRECFRKKTDRWQFAGHG